MQHRGHLPRFPAAGPSRPQIQAQPSCLFLQPDREEQGWEQLGRKPWEKQRDVGWGWGGGRFFYKAKANRYATMPSLNYFPEVIFLLLPQEMPAPNSPPLQESILLPTIPSPTPTSITHLSPKDPGVFLGGLLRCTLLWGLACLTPQQGRRDEHLQNGYKTQPWYFGLKIKTRRENNQSILEVGEEKGIDVSTRKQHNYKDHRAHPAYWALYGYFLHVNITSSPQVKCRHDCSHFGEMRKLRPREVIQPVANQGFHPDPSEVLWWGFGQPGHRALPRQQAGHVRKSRSAGLKGHHCTHRGLPASG